MTPPPLLLRDEWNLHFDGVDLEALAAEHGTPLHVFSPRALRQSIERFGAPFREAGLRLALHFSAKTNHVPSILRVMAEGGVGLEIISPFEDWLARRCGFAGDALVVTGAHFRRDQWPDLLADPPLFWAIESTSQLHRLLDGLPDLPRPLPVALRICPGLSTAPWALGESSGASGSPFGFDPSSASFDEALSAVRASPKVDFVGLHLHLGSGIASARPYRRAFEVLRPAIERAARAGARTRIVDIGGGFGHAPAPIRAPLEVLGLRRRDSEEALHPDAALAAQGALLTSIAEALAELDASMRRAGLEIERFVAEPGRALVADCQLTLLGVHDVIERGGGARHVICDGGAMSLSPMLYVEHHRLLAVRERPGPRTRCAVIGGLPSSLDHVAHGVRLPPLLRGDTLALLDTGAYFDSFENHFAGPRPAIVSVERGRATLVRRRERFDEVIARDELPGRLTPRAKETKPCGRDDE